ncbi:transcriptional regulator, LysR family [Halopseudomonas xinjiangensis]|uniref:Transcriptional regulator, LysR family n=1 Tax=Halopseudomonas xinjiangensis TaxID=487184 RepID=A0A1H1PAN8_9GAMM|nr:transcriptional regulator, LysR family [Halopseudomonas xinjiangensis]
MNANNLSWDDLRVVLAIARNGSLAGAARSLESSHATIFRRLNALERRIGIRLFFRSRKGYTPTPAGDDLSATAARIELEMLGAERRLTGQDDQLSGTIRLTTTDSLLAGPLAPALSRFSKTHPSITLEIALSNRLYDLGTRDADMAVRPGSNPDERLIGRKVGSIVQSVYASSAAQETHAWIGPDRQLGYVALERWMQASGIDARCSFRADSVLGMYHAVRAGLGKAVLSDYLAENQQPLVSLSEPIAELKTELWILTHPDVARAQRIKALRAHLVSELQAAFAR